MFRLSKEKLAPSAKHSARTPSHLNSKLQLFASLGRRAVRVASIGSMRMGIGAMRLRTAGVDRVRAIGFHGSSSVTRENRPHATGAGGEETPPRWKECNWRAPRTKARRIRTYNR